MMTYLFPTVIVKISFLSLLFLETEFPKFIYISMLNCCLPTKTTSVVWQEDQFEQISEWVTKRCSENTQIKIQKMQVELTQSNIYDETLYENN